VNERLENFKRDIKGKNVAVLGIGISNIPLIKYLSDLNVNITAFDRADEERLRPVIKEFDEMGIKFCLGKDYLKKLKGFDMIFKTPGMRFDLPELLSAREEGAKITSEMEVFFELCPAQIFAVTGSDGKTTTTTLIYNILKEDGYNCWLGGNIGTPLLSKIDEVVKSDKVIVELSSFQLHTMKKSPDIAVVTNVSPNHLDMHKSFEEYIEAKKNIFRYQTDAGRVVLNYDNLLTSQFSSQASGKVLYFSRANNLKEGAQLIDGTLVYKKDGKVTKLVEADEIVIPGVHNIENYLAASAAVFDYVKPDTIRKVAMSFKGVEHRIELVREYNGVKFYNSSIDSSPSRTMAALNTFNQKVILIAGGKDKGIPYDAIGKPIAEKVKCLILIGATADKIKQALDDAVTATGEEADIPVIRCSTYKEVVSKAYDNAQEGDIVLLSPASTSFDMFNNFEERGNVFKDLVNGLM
jgi:UDP-N-acetylmuramoylalanine--D-glutamate ligase